MEIFTAKTVCTKVLFFHTSTNFKLSFLFVTNSCFWWRLLCPSCKPSRCQELTHCSVHEQVPSQIYLWLRIKRWWLKCRIVSFCSFPQAQRSHLSLFNLYFKHLINILAIEASGHPQLLLKPRGYKLLSEPNHSSFLSTLLQMRGARQVGSLFPVLQCKELKWTFLIFQPLDCQMWILGPF